MSRPLAYFISWRCYGTWLPGDERGWVSRKRNRFGTSYHPGNHRLEHHAKRALVPDGARSLSPQERACVEHAIRDQFAHRAWELIALNVRTNHVHVIMRPPERQPEGIMLILKAYATRSLRDAGLVGPQARMWARHGSTQRLWTHDEVDLKRLYVLDGQ